VRYSWPVVFTRHCALAALPLVVLAACSGDDSPTCLQNLDEQCQPLFQPTYAEIYSRVLEPTCGVGARCHSAEGARAGLVFADEASSHDQLLQLGYVTPGDPSCSVLVRRIEGEGIQMPPLPADKLLEGERCAIEKWIANGAER
jgi:hypothetical protein